MTKESDVLKLQTSAGVASAEAGLVILDGPDGLALTMTPTAAAETGHRLIAAAGLAQQQADDAAAGANDDASSAEPDGAPLRP